MSYLELLLRPGRRNRERRRIANQAAGDPRASRGAATDAALTVPAPRLIAVLEVLQKLPELGVGKRVTREAWAPYGNSYWEITSVKPRKAAEVGGAARLLLAARCGGATAASRRPNLRRSC
jgi:hypothetical protein